MSERKREGRPGIALTAVLCLTFLYFWFRPDRHHWQQEPIVALVGRALAEPAPGDIAGRLLLDFDLMELAILQAGLGMSPEGLETAGAIATPVVQAVTIRQLAQSHLNHEAPRMGDALDMCDRIADASLREEARNDILLQIASLGFTDVVLPEAHSPLLRAGLARRLAETDDRQTARTLLQELEASLPSLPAGDAGPIREHLAWIRVSLSLTDGPDQAIPAILGLPEDVQPDLWKNLFGWCSGRVETAARDLGLILSQIRDPELRRSLELESLQSGQPIRSADDILAELETAVSTSAPGAARTEALLQLADARYRVQDDAASVPALQSARAEAAGIADPVERTRLFAQLASVLPNSLLMAEAQEARQAATESVRRIPDPAVRFTHLTALARHWFNAGDLALATRLAAEAGEIVNASVDGEGAVELAAFLSRIGDWEGAVALLKGLHGSPLHDAALRECAATIAGECVGYSPAEPPSRGQPLDRIRSRTSTGNPDDEAAAADEAALQPAGLPRARAWLAIAKGRLLSSTPVDEALGAPGTGDLPDPEEAFPDDDPGADDPSADPAPDEPTIPEAEEP